MIFFISFILIFNKRSPLHLAVSNKSLQIVQLLLTRKDIDISIEDEILILKYKSNLWF